MKALHVESAKLMAKGQITLPKDIREALGLRAGDRVTLVRQGTQVTLINSAVYAMQFLQHSMEGEAEAAGIATEEAAEALVRQLREA